MAILYYDQVIQNIYFYDKFEFLYTLKNCHELVFPYNLLFEVTLFKQFMWVYHHILKYCFELLTFMCQFLRDQYKKLKFIFYLKYVKPITFAIHGSGLLDYLCC